MPQCKKDLMLLKSGLMFFFRKYDLDVSRLHFCIIIISHVVVGVRSELSRSPRVVKGWKISGKFPETFQKSR